MDQKTFRTLVASEGRPPPCKSCGTRARRRAWNPHARSWHPRCYPCHRAHVTGKNDGTVRWHW